VTSKALIEHMNISLADSYVVLLRTQDVHWNFLGNNFYGMHKMTMEQYEDIVEGVDEIAERIRAKGHPAPSGLAKYLELTRIKISEDSTSLNGHGMCQHLIDANQVLCKTFYETVKLAEQDGDTATADLITERITQHEKFVWMLTATISGAD
jgi:starvation-inducible DNA-binding protein